MVKDKNNKRFSEYTKAEVLEMLKDRSYSVVEIGKAYGISTSTLHKWKDKMPRQRTTPLPISSSSSQFVEVAVIDQKKPLKKALMVF